MRRTFALKAALALVSGLLWSHFTFAQTLEPKPAHGFSVFGTLKYSPEFPHYDFVNPDAPKGGQANIAITGSFDTLNETIVKGTAAQGISLIYERLMHYSVDELGSSYGFIAKSITVAPDYSWVIYDLNPRARWHDGTPISAADVVFSFELIRDKASPVWRGFMTEITKAEILSPSRVKFTFNGPNNHKLIHSTSGLMIFPKHYWATRNFADTTMEPPLGSGAYRIASVDQGRTITYERVKDYWAKDLNVRRGIHNFDKITYTYFRDANTQFEAFKAGQINERIEYDASKWATAYTFDAVKSGEIVKTTLKIDNPPYILTYAPNMRLPRFADIRVRKALDLAYDFDWLNKNFLFNSYARMDSYFDHSPLGASGLPSARELELLAPWKDTLPEDLFLTPFKVNHSDGSGQNRQNLLHAMNLLKEAGWQVQDGTLTHTATGEIFTLELLVNNGLMARMGAPYIAAMKRLGIKASIRQVDSAQYFNRISAFDYDMMVVYLPQTSLPSRELRDFWGSGAAARQGSLNFAGIEDPAVDAMLETIATSNDREEYFAAIKAVDRILLWKNYMIPMYNNAVSWRAHAKDLKFPKRTSAPLYDYGWPHYWWREGAEERQ